MSNLFIKYLPEEGEIKMYDWYINSDGELCLYQGALPEYHYNGAKKATPHLCTRDVQVGDKVFPFIGGHMDNVLISPFHPKVHWDTRNFMCGWPDEPHTILDLNHPKTEGNHSHKIRTDYGYGSIGRYIKVLGKISPDATCVTDGIEVEEEDVQFYADYDLTKDSFIIPEYWQRVIEDNRWTNK